MTYKSPGACRHLDCLGDAIYNGFCYSHSADVKCDGCGHELQEHKEVDGELRCPPPTFRCAR